MVELEHLALNYGTAEPQHYKKTAHYTVTQYIHSTYDTEEPLNQSRGKTRAPSP